MHERLDTVESSENTQKWGPPWLTVEFGLYLLLVLTGGLLRFYALERQPLQEGEARLALDAWKFYTGTAASLRGHGPLLFHGNVLLFILFGSNDYVSRALPAMAGSLMVGLPYLLRSYLGRRGALISSAILALSPSFVFFSRQLGGDIIVSGCGLLGLAGLLGYVHEARASRLYLVAGALAVSLTAGGANYSMVLSLGAFLLALFLYSRFGSGRLARVVRESLWRSVEARVWLRAGGLFAAIVVLVSTGLFVNLQGLQATLDLLAHWLAQFAPVPDGQPWSYYISLLLVYELPALVLGLAGACYLCRRDLFWALLVCWFGVSLVLYSAMGTKPPSGVLQMLLPLTLLAGRTVGDLLSRITEPESWVWDRLALLTSIPVLAYIVLQLAAFANPQDPGDPRHLILVLMSVFFVVCVILITGVLSLDWKRTLRTGGAVLLLVLSPLMLRATCRLNYHRPGNPLEPLVERPTSPDVRNLVRAVEDTSNQREMDRHSIGVTVSGSEDPVLAWYLRGFANLAFRLDVASSLTPVVITPFGERVPRPDYRGERFRLQSSWQGERMASHTLLGWYLYREALSPPTNRDIVMWVAP
jgi:uncharacterized protein (TIGR03663 family)